MYAENSAGGFPPPGTVVSIPIGFGLRHRGVVSDRWYQGKPMVISGSGRARGVCEESWELFAAGQPVRNEGYPSTLPAWQVLDRVRAVLGTPYHLFNWNCDHVVAVAHGRRPESPQLAATVALATVATLILAVSARS